MTAECQAFRHAKLSSIRASLDEDLLRYLNKSPLNQAAGDSLRTRMSAFLTPDVLAVFLHRIAHWLYVNGWLRLAVTVSRMNFFIHKVSINPESCIGPGFRLPHPAGTVFCGSAGRDLTLYALSVCCPIDGCADGPAASGPQIGDSVSIGAHTAVLGAVRVGSGTKLAYTLRLAQDAPAGVLVISGRRRIRRPVVAQSSSGQSGPAQAAASLEPQEVLG